jgi:hypothetical protein
MAIREPAQINSHAPSLVKYHLDIAAKEVLAYSWWLVIGIV